jgi:hypothetical protein
MNKQEVAKILGAPVERIEVIEDGREVWLYSPFPVENCFKRETQRVLRLMDSPFLYCRFTYIFDKLNNVEAWTFAGEDEFIKTRDGYIRGDSILEYCKQEQVRR